jgi:uncharacterized cupin superfamily protein
METPDQEKVVVRAADAKAGEDAFSHPWNPKSKIVGTHLSKLAGLKRTGVSLVRVPAGHESFAYHEHHCEEEWVYILEGRAIADINGKSYEVGPGDFIGYPAPGYAHLIRNPFGTDVVYLMGGENREVEVADFPTLGKRMVRTGRDFKVYDIDAARDLSEAAPSKPPAE